MTGSARALRVGIPAVVVVVLALLPFGPDALDFFVLRVLSRALIFGIVAATIVMLARYGGMTSLGQILFYGVAGFMYGNAVSSTGARGLNLGWSPWVSVLFALAIATVLGLVLGAVASRATGIYFLMLTLVYAVIGFQVFFNIIDLSGQSGITSITPPALFATPLRVYYGALAVSAVVYAAFVAIRRTNFGLALQGVRDDPVRMASLGFNVAVHRMVAFTLGAFVAAVAGLLFVWSNGQITPNTIGIGPAIVFLIIAVIGGISSFAGAWVGALVYVVAEFYIRDLPLMDRIGLTADRFNTLIGVLVLLIMVLSPDGLAGIGNRLRRSRAATPLSERRIDAGEPSPATETKGTAQ